jgi:Resolvase, N terminal domain
VHSFSRFFRDAFGLEFYVRKLAKHGVRLVSITQELGDDPAQVMMRQVIALFDEYQSKENATAQALYAADASQASSRLTSGSNAAIHSTMLTSPAATLSHRMSGSPAARRARNGGHARDWGFCP